VFRDADGLAAFLALQRRGYRVVVVQKDQHEVTIRFGRANAPVEEDVMASGRTLAAALRAAAEKVGIGADFSAPRFSR
jgi:hypothetical protein